ncbi:DUF3592 domain-containing protein [Streptomyces guryensis]|uniref:DUF3592 domain-containing protein n=1 Tax=Streptomyces guryensis TaxID=2886947 RepID=A0A9Q3VQ95_9ACTN|nr:DUF3592 domain-containing protein [Streptomyces guryensis]MCD9876481.1 DUF3592 domain-containing protein [Streptomyces guryensis]
MIAFGALFLAIGLILAGQSVSLLADAERARGTVVSVQWRTEHSSSFHKNRTSDKRMAYPVVAFTSADGTRRTFQDSTGANPPSYETGEQVEVLYRAGSPQDARINGFVSLWLGPLVFGGLGLLAAGIGTAVAWATRRRSRVA